jgi:hypothetical protein
MVLALNLLRSAVAAALMTTVAGPQRPPAAPSDPVNASRAPVSEPDARLLQAVMMGKIADVRAALAAGAKADAVSEAGTSAITLAAIYGRFSKEEPIPTPRTLSISLRS